MAAPASPSTSAAPRTATAFPSVKTEQPLVESYTFHSVDKEAASGKGKEVARGPADGEWLLGVDEAGRGPVLGESTRSSALLALPADPCGAQTGPQVYGIAFCQLGYSDELKSLGFAGQLSHLARRRG